MSQIRASWIPVYPTKSSAELQMLRMSGIFLSKQYRRTTQLVGAINKELTCYGDICLRKVDGKIGGSCMKGKKKIRPLWLVSRREVRHRITGRN